MSDSPLTQAEQQKLATIKEAISGNITNGDAARKLGLSVRQVQRIKSQIRKNGNLAIVHKLKGQLSNHHINLKVKHQILEEIKNHYADFKPKFATEKVLEKHPVPMTSQTVRVWMNQVGLWKIRQQKQSGYHAFRERMEYFGELQQFDGSYHLWFEGRLVDGLGNPVEICLLAAIDDATGKITHAKFGFNEGVVAVFNFWKEYVQVLGKPLKIYLDKFSTYKINHKAAVDNAELLTQFQMVARVLNIELISANSPQAKGRIERLFQTLQDRLVKELRLANINSITAGNKFLKDIFLPKFNQQFTVRPTKSGNVHRQLTKAEKLSLSSIFSIKSQRRINYDFTIQFKNHFYQLEEIQLATIRPKDKVTTEEWLDGTLHFKFKENYLKYFVLPEKPKKLSSQPVVLTTHPLNWKPPLNHPWRQYKQKLLNLKG